MKITFTELEEVEQRRFEEGLREHEVSFVRSLADVLPETEVLSVFISSRITEDFLARHPAVQLVATRSTTRDHIDLESCARRGVTVATVTSYGDHIVAEHTFALLLALTRRLREAMHLNGGKRFSYEALRGVELNGKTFGILGAGRVGLRTVPIARAFDMEVIAHDIAPRPEAAASLGFEYVSLDELLRRSHFVCLSVPLTGDTFHILDRDAFAKCRRGVVIINTARGRLIDTAALLEALESGVVGGAGLDVLGEEAALRRQAAHLISDQIVERIRGEEASAAPERTKQIEKLMLIDRLLARPNVVFTPHIAFNCAESVERINTATLENIRRFTAGESLVGLSRLGPAVEDSVRRSGELGVRRQLGAQTVPLGGEAQPKPRL